jgi:hypothetical protein
VNDQETAEKKVSLPRLRDEFSTSRERNRSEDHLRESELGRRDTGDLAEEVEPEDGKGQKETEERAKRASVPSDSPAHQGTVTAGNEEDGGGVESSVGRVGLWRREGREDQ